MDQQLEQLEQLENLAMENDICFVELFHIFSKLRRAAKATQHWLQLEKPKTDKEQIIQYIAKIIEEIDRDVDKLHDKRKEINSNQ